jgi:hypothetical protein
VFDLVLFQLFQVQQRVVRSFGHANQLIELGLNRSRIAILRVLNQEHHQKRDDRRPSIDHQLPRIIKRKHRPRRCPDNDYQCRQGKCLGMPRMPRRRLRKFIEPVNDWFH